MERGGKDKSKLNATCKNTGDYFRFCLCSLICCTLQRNRNCTATLGPGMLVQTGHGEPCKAKCLPVTHCTQKCCLLSNGVH